MATEWKSGNLTTVFKKDEDTRKENYRPVSFLTAISKVYEKVMFEQTLLLHRTLEDD